MTPQIANNALTLLQRVQISGAEVPVFVQIMAALEAIANPPKNETLHDKIPQYDIDS